MVEGTPLLRVQIGNGLEGSNPFLSATLPHIDDLTCLVRLHVRERHLVTNSVTIEDYAALRGLGAPISNGSVGDYT